MSGIQRFRGKCVWMREQQDEENRRGLVELAILRPTELVMDVVTDSGRYSVRMSLTGEAIYQGHWQAQGLLGHGLAECTTGAVLRTRGIDTSTPEEPGVLQFDGSWVENGKWWWVGRLEEIDSL